MTYEAEAELVRIEACQLRAGDEIRVNGKWRAIASVSTKPKHLIDRGVVRAYISHIPPIEFEWHELVWVMRWS